MQAPRNIGRGSKDWFYSTQERIPLLIRNTEEKIMQYSTQGQVDSENPICLGGANQVPQYSAGNIQRNLLDQHLYIFATNVANSGAALRRAGLCQSFRSIPPEARRPNSWCPHRHLSFARRMTRSETLRQRRDSPPALKMDNGTWNPRGGYF